MLYGGQSAHIVYNLIRPKRCLDMEGPCKHQPAAGLIPYRPIIDGQKLLADSLGNRVKTCAGAAGEDEACHCIVIRVHKSLMPPFMAPQFGWLTKRSTSACLPMDRSSRQRTPGKPSSLSRADGEWTCIIVFYIDKISHSSPDSPSSKDTIHPKRPPIQEAPIGQKRYRYAVVPDLFAKIRLNIGLLPFPLSD